MGLIRAKPLHEYKNDLYKNSFNELGKSILFQIRFVPTIVFKNLNIVIINKN